LHAILGIRKASQSKKLSIKIWLKRGDVWLQLLRNERLKYLCQRITRALPQIDPLPNLQTDPLPKIQIARASRFSQLRTAIDAGDSSGIARETFDRVRQELELPGKKR